MKAAKIIFTSFKDKSTKLKLFENNKLNTDGYTSYFKGEIMQIYFLTKTINYLNS